MFRLLLAACLVLTVSVSTGACKDDKELDDIPAPSAEQIAAAKKKAAERKKAKDDKKKSSKKDPKKDAKKDRKAASKDDKAGATADGKPKSAKDTAAERREKRKQRLAELKKRSEERRKERLDRLKKRRDDNAKKRADAALKSDKTRTAMAKAATGKKKGAAKPDGKTRTTPSTLAKKTPAKKDVPARTTPSRPSPGPAASATPAPATPVNALKIARYVSISDVKEITAKPDLRAAGALVGIAPSARYNSVVFVGNKDAFGAAVQVWKEVTQRAADRRFRNMKRDYPNVQDTGAVSTKGFFSSFGDLMTLVFFEPFKRTIVAVTCSTEVCTQESLLALAKRVKTQM